MEATFFYVTDNLLDVNLIKVAKKEENAYNETEKMKLICFDDNDSSWLYDRHTIRIQKRKESLVRKFKGRKKKKMNQAQILDDDDDNDAKENIGKKEERKEMERKRKR